MTRRSRTGSHRRDVRTITTIAALGIAILGVGCGSASSESDAGGAAISIVATTTVWGDVVSEVTGADAAVDVLVPIGADIHGFELSSQQVARIQQADLVVANGLGLEAGMRDALDAAQADGANILWLAEELDPLPFGSHGSDDDANGLDPHVWLDPQRVAVAASLITQQLAVVEPAIDWSARAEAYAASLDGADSLIVETLIAVPQDARKMVTNHDAFEYFADRYGFDVIGVVIPGGSTLGDPSSSELASLVDVMYDEGVTALFSETTTSPALAEAVAAELGQDVVVVELFAGSLGPPGSGAETLIGMLVTNAERIAQALAP